MRNRSFGCMRISVVVLEPVKSGGNVEIVCFQMDAARTP
jgi:hypothetical protein